MCRHCRRGAAAPTPPFPLRRAVQIGTIRGAAGLRLWAFRYWSVQGRPSTGRCTAPRRRFGTCRCGAFQHGQCTAPRRRFGTCLCGVVPAQISARPFPVAVVEVPVARVEACQHLWSALLAPPARWQVIAHGLCQPEIGSRPSFALTPHRSLSKPEKISPLCLFEAVAMWGCTLRAHDC